MPIAKCPHLFSYLVECFWCGTRFKDPVDRRVDIKRWRCVDDHEHTCGRMSWRGTPPRCQVYNEILDGIVAASPSPEHPPWWTFTNGDSTLAEAPVAYARPKNLILKGRLVESGETSPGASIPYIAVSYTWTPDPKFVPWSSRRVTTQALAIAKRLARHVQTALWIDAICIDQDDNQTKKHELRKMSDIYRGAIAVVCLVSDIRQSTCDVVHRCVSVLDHEVCSALQKAGDLYGWYMFATAAGNEDLVAMFGHRWWERAWTFQEATLNQRTFLIGDAEDTIPIADVLKIATVVRHRAASTIDLTLGRSPAFWDSVAAMVESSQRPLTLGESMACVWRRQAKIPHDMVYALTGVCNLAAAVSVDYERPFAAVLRELFDAASAAGDYSWVPWCASVAQWSAESGMALAPTPDIVRAAPFTAVTSWRSTPIPPTPELDGADTGVLVPFRSTGVIRTTSAPMSVADTVAHLRSPQLGFTDAEIWDMLFGVSVGLMGDIVAEFDNDISTPALNATLIMIERGERPTQETRDMPASLPWTHGVGFMSYTAAAVEAWTRMGHSALLVLSSQGGTAVVPAECGVVPGAGARMHVLPAEAGPAGSERRLVFVARDETRFRAIATALLVVKRGAGGGRWQLRRIG